MNVHTSHLRPDGTTWPPVTPDPPPPPGYVDPIPALDDALAREQDTEADARPDAEAHRPQQPAGPGDQHPPGVP